MAEPTLDLSEIIDLYKEDAKKMVEKMRSAVARWEEIQHQLRGSGRTYGYRQVTRFSKALESIMQKLEKAQLPADDRSRKAIQDKIERIAAAFAA
jgi:flagellar hook-basal body complex protein FliE